MAEIVGGRKVVAAAGTAEPLVAGSTKASHIVIQAETNNTGVICVGDSSVDETQASRNGIALNAGDSFSTPCDDINDIYIDASVTGDGVTYFYKIGK